MFLEKALSEMIAIIIFSAQYLSQELFFWLITDTTNVIKKITKTNYKDDVMFIY